MKNLIGNRYNVNISGVLWQNLCSLKVNFAQAL